MKLDYTKTTRPAKKSKTTLDMQVNALYSKYCDGVQFDIFDLSKVLSQFRESVERYQKTIALDTSPIQVNDLKVNAAHTLDLELLSVVAYYRKN